MFATLLLALTPGQFINNNDFPRARQEAALAATVAITHAETNGEGTAVVVNSDKGSVYLLTAAHVVPPGGDKGDLVKVDFYSPKTFPKVDESVGGFVRVRNAEKDLAVIQVPIKNPETRGVLRICPKNKLPKTEKLRFPVLTVGCDGPNRTPRLLIDLVIDKKIPVKPNRAKVLCWETEGKPVQGRSGGPLIDTRGYLMGVCSGSENQRGYYAYISEIYKAVSATGFGWLIES